MNKNIIMMYKCILEKGWVARAEKIKNGIYAIGLYKEPYKMNRFFYLYPRNPYTGEFVDG